MVDRHLNPQFSQRMPQKIIDMLDKYAAERGVSRNKIVNDAVLFYVSSIECVKCGALNTPGGLICSRCGTPLFEIHGEIEAALVSLVRPENSKYESVKTFLQVMEKCRKKYAKLGCKVGVDPVIDKTKTQTEYRIKLLLTLDDGVTKVLPDEDLDMINNGVVIPGELLVKELMQKRDEYMSPKNREAYREVIRLFFATTHSMDEKEMEMFFEESKKKSK